jgi:hypothetical protein
MEKLGDSLPEAYRWRRIKTKQNGFPCSNEADWTTNTLEAGEADGQVLLSTATAH